MVSVVPGSIPALGVDPLFIEFVCSPYMRGFPLGAPVRMNVCFRH